jgi:hypothetical protein
MKTLLASLKLDAICTTGLQGAMDIKEKYRQYRYIGNADSKLLCASLQDKLVTDT